MLFSEVTTRNLAHCLAVSSHDQVVTVRDMLQLKRINQPVLEKLKGQNVALFYPDSFTLSLVLLLLDGVCRRLVILPPERNTAELNQFIAMSGVDHIVSAETLAFDTNVLSTLMTVDVIPADEQMDFPRVFDKIHGDFHTEWVLATSGTTGIPKLVVHDLRSLTQNTKKTLKNSKFKWGLLYDIHRFAGLQVFFQALFGGSPLVFVNQLSDFGDKIGHFVRHNCNALSATPTMWRKILMLGSSDWLLSSITLGGEIADNNILRALTNRFPDAYIRHIYASTEAGVGFTVTDGKAGFPDSYLVTPANNIQLKIVDDILWLRSTCVAKGYLTDESISLDSDQGYVNTGDRVQKVDDRYEFLGRDSGMINVGGNKVHPEEIEKIINDFPGVAMCTVYAKKSSVMGALVAVNILPSEQNGDFSAFKKELKSFCAARLESFKIPVIMRLVNSIDTNSTGKLERTS